MDEPKDTKEKETLSTDTKKGFFQFVFNFDEETKSNLLNLVQFSCIAFIPIIALNKAMQKYVPEADDQKSSIELTIEVVGQIIVMFIGIFFIHRIIVFIPTFSEVKYPDFNVIITVIPILIISLSLQTKLGEKVSILGDRLAELWNGNNSKSKKKKSQNNSSGVTITQPLSSSSTQSFVGNGQYNGTTNINSLPSSSSSPDFDTFYQQTGGGGGTTNGGGNIHSGGSQQYMEEPSPILAANEVLGGSFGSGF